MYICLQYLQSIGIFPDGVIMATATTPAPAPATASTTTASTTCRECTRTRIRTGGAPMPHADTCKFAHILPVFDFTPAMRCIQCENMDAWLASYPVNDEPPPAPRPHSYFCPSHPNWN